ncbi:hypothetical protein NOM01_04450 [Sporolactobacillus sp. STSJ-5]|uniref:hypothetical protein n=1 Tax=Sporolactobacillus sp. STSJ-5 TaxID=2965076 RepID=UPI00210851BE|nr:hypothetical protein [Sporolactobacillus sp. STSJ-5]MCQ2009244.1 hypothetical protein [Sporolactobacillus sp. STSJ-5]
MEKSLRIKKIEVPIINGKAELKDDGLYIVSGGKIVMYPLPEYGTVEIKSHAGKADHPLYHVFAEK